MSKLSGALLLLLSLFLSGRSSRRIFLPLGPPRRVFCQLRHVVHPGEDDLTVVLFQELVPGCGRPAVLVRLVTITSRVRRHGPEHNVDVPQVLETPDALEQIRIPVRNDAVSPARLDERRRHGEVPDDMDAAADDAAFVDNGVVMQGRAVVAVVEPKSVDFGHKRPRILPNAADGRFFLRLLFHNAQGKEARFAAQVRDGGPAALRDQPARVLDLGPVPAGVDEFVRVAPINAGRGEEREAPDLGAQLGGEVAQLGFGGHWAQDLTAGLSPLAGAALTGALAAGAALAPADDLARVSEVSSLSGISTCGRLQKALLLLLRLELGVSKLRGAARESILGRARRLRRPGPAGAGPPARSLPRGAYIDL
ncbi:hypothetical protein PpBr36_08601 [Pyricularia pennisetigena]|uniref:hypothetical protein n=1 Tax=Pyricularia pennisetigena TaxID=1578925 RepID=UPI00114E0810|nr:hypothetical protein PpBr36_08601 [Pyricularia pennisetigena]TLS24869.1 hypothetical protein PpBr36_08601 [Pyricularia pennisetigena]